MTIIIIACELAQETERAWGLFDGVTHDITDHATGEISTRRHYHWVPKAQSTILKRTRSPSAVSGGAPCTIVEIQLPEWLAEKAGLLGGRCNKTKDLFR